ncbi:hypothetical protein K450DRAFT_284491 [Umbelopsis ramanniana AG]|uniref:Uncharacterized protein n=1 Tax=Umbelopsis ramanniana AG TaxID=1314678 RepID=A0AAD5E1Y9_UMBRA|nr:uncharacterized protein K450DRAFT_284491 [Umbelopsis ramanniana AG]KAI8575277.1 hypothetical protein K450DRAFT_284491 [Umbelopsis ramanniana AG]
MLYYSTYFAFFGFLLLFFLVFICVFLIRKRRALQAEASHPTNNDLQDPYDLCPVNYPTPPIPPQTFDGQRAFYQPPTAAYNSGATNDIDEATTPPSPPSCYEHASSVLEPAPPTYEETVSRPENRETSNHITNPN